MSFELGFHRANLPESFAVQTVFYHLVLQRAPRDPQGTRHMNLIAGMQRIRLEKETPLKSGRPLPKIQGIWLRRKMGLRQFRVRASISVRLLKYADSRTCSSSTQFPGQAYSVVAARAPEPRVTERRYRVPAHAKSAPPPGA